MIALQAVGARRAENGLCASLCLRPRDHREFDIIAGRNAQHSQRCPKNPQAFSAFNVPGFTFEPGHHNLVLICRLPIRHIQRRPVYNLPIVLAKGSGSAEHRDPKLAGEIRIMGVNSWPQGNHGPQRGVQIARRRFVDCGQFHRRIFGKHQQLCALRGGIAHPLPDLALPTGKAIGFPDGILGCRYTDRRGHRSRIQNCMACALSKSSPRSCHSSVPVKPGTGA